MRASEGLTDCPSSVWAIIEGASANDRRTRDIQFLFMASPGTENLWRTGPHVFMGCARVHKRRVQLSFGKSVCLKPGRFRNGSAPVNHGRCQIASLAAR